jgi:hypothetical protein
MTTYETLKLEAAAAAGKMRFMKIDMIACRVDSGRPGRSHYKKMWFFSSHTKTISSLSKRPFTTVHYVDGSMDTWISGGLVELANY